MWGIGGQVLVVLRQWVQMGVCESWRISSVDTAALWPLGEVAKERSDTFLLFSTSAGFSLPSALSSHALCSAGTGEMSCLQTYTCRYIGRKKTQGCFSSFLSDFLSLSLSLSLPLFTSTTLWLVRLPGQRGVLAAEILNTESPVSKREKTLVMRTISLKRKAEKNASNTTTTIITMLTK